MWLIGGLRGRAEFAEKSLSMDFSLYKGKLSENGHRERERECYVNRLQTRCFRSFVAFHKMFTKISFCVHTVILRSHVKLVVPPLWYGQIGGKTKENIYAQTNQSTQSPLPNKYLVRITSPIYQTPSTVISFSSYISSFLTKPLTMLWSSPLIDLQSPHHSYVLQVSSFFYLLLFQLIY